ncbi:MULTISPECIES: hypothetical protein [unclassified Kaistella]|uniref:hypothetical protein n=1 Tax=unclassified Kaistella TaxID=2762626 RepID=UPI002736E940|nr:MULTISPECIES: hypothetical protein [unclassified Kaistella]MDP2452648.1 hypothetical protein [Kaistella sp. SH11-4b]MDP2455557.1 hypothetical protein [Kaistella sp. SH40-3]MDP2458461.1 hypothetical protein [Kaistella sp. SH19-2b]
MGDLVKKETIERIVDRRIEGFDMSQESKEKIRKKINTDELVDFANNGVNSSVVLNMSKESQSFQVSSFEDIMKYVVSIVKWDIVEGVVKALSELKDFKIPPNKEETINMLIDLKTLDDPGNFQRILADIFENDLAV